MWEGRFSSAVESLFPIGHHPLATRRQPTIRKIPSIEAFLSGTQTSLTRQGKREEELEHGGMKREGDEEDGCSCLNLVLPLRQV